MPTIGSSIFTDADGYQASMRDMFDLLVVRPPEFQARLTWLELPRLYLLRAHETAARIAYVTFPPALIFLTFPTRPSSVLICDGVELQFGEIMLHGRGDRLHQRTVGECHWGSVSLAPAFLMNAAMTITGHNILLPRGRQVLRPIAANRRLLLRLHAETGRLAETVPSRIYHNEVVRALEQDLVLALLNCWVEGEEERERAQGSFQQPSKLIQFEAMLAANPSRILPTQSIASTLGVSAQSLRKTCSKLLGMSPGRYQRLRRLKLVRAELKSPDFTTVNIVDIVERYGFPDVHGFTKEYWNAYGEMPPIPVSRATGR